MAGETAKNGSKTQVTLILKVIEVQVCESGTLSSITDESDYADSVTDGADETDLQPNVTKGGGGVSHCEKAAVLTVKEATRTTDELKSADKTGVPYSLAETVQHGLKQVTECTVGHGRNLASCACDGKIPAIDNGNHTVDSYSGVGPDTQDAHLKSIGTSGASEYGSPSNTRKCTTAGYLDGMADATENLLKQDGWYFIVGGTNTDHNE